MASKKSEYYFELSARMQHALSQLDQHKSELLNEVAKFEAELCQRKTKVEEKIKTWDELINASKAKLEALRLGVDEDRVVERLRQDADNAVVRLADAA